ncbi:MAG: site-specific integrase, partial [Acidobacteria bacterium]|nr:site-specific integrase [Acidobacteriota bacterium]
MATIRKRNNRYQVQIRLKGKAPVSETFTRKTDAERWAAKTETEILEGRFFPKAEAARHTFREVADRYRRTVMVRKS